jgi:hypothetical protein
VAIVGLRVEVLKLGSGVGRQLEQATTLQSSNAVLRARISALSDNQRIVKLAEGYGMEMPNPLDVHFVESSAAGNVGAAISKITAPSRETFLSSLASERQTDDQSTQAESTLSAIGPATGSTETADSTGSTTDASVTSPETGATTADTSTDSSTVAADSTSAYGSDTGVTSAPDSTADVSSGDTAATESTDTAATGSSDGVSSTGSTPVDSTAGEGETSTPSESGVSTNGGASIAG